MSTNSTSIEANVSGSKLDQMGDALLGSDDYDSNDANITSIINDTLNVSKDRTNINDDNGTFTGNDEEGNEDLSWSKVLGVDDKNVVLDDDGNFAGINVKVDGEVSTVDLQTLIAGYQTTKSYTQKTQQLAEEKRTFDAVRNQASEEYISKLTAVDKLSTHLQQKLIGEFQHIDWKALRIQNPGEYAALVQDYSLRKEEMDNIFAAIRQEQDAELNKKQSEVSNVSKEYLVEQARKLVEKNPEWADKGKLQAAFQDFEKFAGKAYGFTPQEFAQVQDHRLIELLKDAKSYRDSLNINAKKVVKQLPTYQKSSGNAVKKQTKLEQLINVANKSSGMKKKEAQTNAIAELLLTGG